MTVDQMIEQLMLIRKTFNAGDHYLAMTVLGVDGFTSVDVQLCGASLEFKGVDKPCVSLVVIRSNEGAIQAPLKRVGLADSKLLNVNNKRAFLYPINK